MELTEFEDVGAGFVGVVKAVQYGCQTLSTEGKDF
jgi:hypothetical protein